MDAMTALKSRVTPLRLVEPAPAGEALEALLEAATRAPDHGKLRPWRMLVIEGEGRAKLGALMVEALKRSDPEAPEPLLAREAEKPMRAPMIIALAAKIEPEHPKIPVLEQIMSAACAAQNIQLAAHALGFGCMWKTGAPSRDEGIKAALGLAPTDQLVGFIYVGTPDGLPQPRPVTLDTYVSRWPAD